MPELWLSFLALEERGRGKGRAPAGTRDPCRKCARGDRRLAGNSLAFPAAVVFSLYAICLARRALLPPSPCGLLASKARLGRCATTRLDASVRASAPRDFTDRGRPRRTFEGLRALTLEAQARTLFSAVRPAPDDCSRASPGQARSPPCISVRATLPRPPHPKPAYPDDRDTPHIGRDASVIL